MDLPPRPDVLPGINEIKAQTDAQRDERRGWMARSERQRAEVVDRYRRLVAEHGDGAVADAVIQRHERI